MFGRLMEIADQELVTFEENNRPKQLGERFAELFDKTWSSAFECLRPKGIDDEVGAEKSMDTLQQIVKVCNIYTAVGNIRDNTIKDNGPICQSYLLKNKNKKFN